MRNYTDTQTRRNMARYKRRRAKAVAKGCTCVMPLRYDDEFLSGVSRALADLCPFHKGKTNA